MLFTEDQGRQIGPVHGRDGLLHLEKERVSVTVAKKQHQIRTGADASHADHAVGHVGDGIPLQHGPVSRQEALGVLGQ